VKATTSVPIFGRRNQETVFMRLRSKIAALLAFVTIPACSAASAAVIGGTYFAPQYDYAEFFAATDRRNFQVILVGNPFPGMDPNTVASQLLPVMQDAKPRPALTFTYDAPVERPHPYYRLVLIANPTPDLGSATVCNGQTRVRGAQPGVFYIYAVYCRNDQPLSETTAWVQATGPTDPRINELFRQLFQAMFPDAVYRNLNGRGGGMRQ
jgi:hypothetical protein